IARERVLDAGESEAAIRDAIRVTPADGAQVRVLLEITIEAVKAEDYISRPTLAVWHQQRRHHAPVVCNLYSHPRGVGQGVKVNGRTVGRDSENFLHEQHDTRSSKNCTRCSQASAGPHAPVVSPALAYSV